MVTKFHYDTSMALFCINSFKFAERNFITIREINDYKLNYQTLDYQIIDDHTLLNNLLPTPSQNR